jgi:hypothetical protein
LRGDCSCQRLAIRFLLSSILSKFLRERLELWCSFIKLGTPPHFSFHKPWLTDSIGCPPTFTNHGGVPFYFILFPFFLFWNKIIWKIANPTTMSPWVENSVTKWEVFWRLLKGSTWKFTWNGLQIPCIGIYSGLIGKLGFWELDAREVFSLNTKWRLAKD